MKPQCAVILALAMLLFSPMAMVLESPFSSASDEEIGAVSIEQQSSARATTTWSGNVWLNSSYHVSSSDALVVSDCTQIWMASGTRIYVDGRLTVEGTQSCPVIIHSQGFGDHLGIQFNSTSRNRGSIVNNLTIEDSEYAVTIYNSNPLLYNLTVEDADRVAVDLYNSASPIFQNLTIQDGGQGLANGIEWRQGIGLSVGNYSTPVVNGFVADGLENRALNVWGNSGGMYRNLNFTNIGGSVLSLSAAIWVEDSQLLIEDVYIDECDNGAYIRHISDSSTTRAVMRRVVIEDSQFRGLMIDKSDHMNYTNYQAAIIEDIVIRGTGGLGAADQNWAEAALEINASGAWIENALIEDNFAPGIRLYFTDSTTTMKNVSVLDSGNANKGPHAAGIYNRAAFFAPEFINLNVSGSAGPGVWIEAGGAIQGQNWTLFNNSAQGLRVDGSALVVDGMEIHDNNLSAVRVYDGRKVEFSNVSTSGNGHQATGPEDGAGMVFIESNDIESNSGNVMCRTCISREDTWGGVWAQDSVDLWLDDFDIHDPLNGTIPIFIDNGGLTASYQGGRFQMLDVNVWVNRSGPAINIVEAAGVIDGLDMHGSHQGLHWDANHNGVWTSELSHAVLRGSDCLILSNHSDLIGVGVNISNDCSGSVQFTDVKANWSLAYDESGSHVLSLDANSNLRLHQPENIDLNQAVIPNGAYIDLAWDMTIWVINQHGNGIPRADVEVSFDQYSADFQYVSDWLGFDKYPNFIGQRWNSTGASAFTQVSVECSYDNTTNTTSFSFNDDEILYCVLDLANQPPFIIWSTPLDQDIFPSGSQVVFNASDSWDLDNDTMTFTWTSSLNGVFGSSSSITVNDGGSAMLDDGIHDITLDICDQAGNCVSETRTIELTNLPPIISITTSPLPDFSNILRPAWTQDVTFNSSSTIDPEDDTLTRRIWTSYWPSSQYCTGTDCQDEWTLNFADSPQANFTLEIGFSDGINQESVWTIEVKLYNEMPIPALVIERDGNTSDQLVSLNSTGTVDPEGDSIGIRWISDVDGTLGESNGTTGILSWHGHLSRATHNILIQVWDDRPEHINEVSELTQTIVVENSAPEVNIETPMDGLLVDTSTLVNFSAEGSGDWDSWCGSYPVGMWLCSETPNPFGSDLLSIDWISNISGALTPEGEDWLIWEGRMPAGNHTVTVTFNDLLGGVSSASFTIDVAQSAPVLGLVTPYDGQGFLSKDTIYIDASDSIDFDGDDFTLSVVSDHPLVNGPILEEVDADTTHPIQLPYGTHQLTLLLRDANGMERSEIITLVVAESTPVAVLDSPEVTPGVSKTLDPTKSVFFSANSSTDADGDIADFEWFRNSDDGWVLILNRSYGEVELASGFHHIKLVVTDTRRFSDELHFNLTLKESWPVLSDLVLSQEKFTAGEKVTLWVSVNMTDEDGSTEIVQGILIHGIQEWEFDLIDNKNGIWNGTLVFTPAEAGRPQLKIKAIDEDVVRELSRDLLVEEEIGEINWGQVGGGIGGGALVILLLIFLMGLRRRKLSEKGVVESWTSFDSALETTPAASSLDQASLVEQEDESMPEMIDL